MAEVLLTYKEVEMLRTSGLPDEEASYLAVLSYDEKLGIQAMQNTAFELPPVPGKHLCTGRDCEYRRHGVKLLGIQKGEFPNGTI